MPNCLIEAFTRQADACQSLGAPFSAGLLREAAHDLATGGPVSHLLTPWEDMPVAQLVRDAVALRLLAGLHYLVLDGQAPQLAACYPPEGRDPGQAWTVVRSLLDRHAPILSWMLAHEPQTNEVRRSTCLLGGFLTIARETGLPLRCFEIGASAGLNSLWDKFRYDIDGQPWGDIGSAVVLPSRWEGNAPALDGAATVMERYACDHRPVEIARRADAIRLLAYCWVDQRERMERLKASIALARTQPVKVQPKSAANFVMDATPQEGAATVVFHSVVWQYIPPAEQREIEDAMHAHTARATGDAPLYWLRMELNEAARQFELRLWAGLTRRDRLLAIVHPHGEFSIWQ
jgi:hypothetical protein